MAIEEKFFSGTYLQSQIVAKYPDGSPITNANNGVPIGSTITFSGEPSTITVLDDDDVLQDNNNASGPVVPDAQSLDLSSQTLKEDFGNNLAGDYVWSRAYQTIEDENGNVGRIYQIRMGDYNYSGGIVEYNLNSPSRLTQYWQLSGDIIASPGTTFTVTGNFNGNANQSFAEFEKPVICFVRGTRIDTKHGECAVESLRVGDWVRTKDNGFQQVRWIGTRALGREQLIASPNLRPIRISKNALAKGFPSTDLYVSPQHRVLVGNRAALTLMGVESVLVAAKHLVDLKGVDYVYDFDEVEYFHIVFDRHEVISSNGTWSESLYTGPEALDTLEDEARAEIIALFPELQDEDYLPELADTITSGRDAREIIVFSQEESIPMLSERFTR